VIKVEGISSPTLPYKLTGFEGTLLFHEYPSTIIYENHDKTPVIKEWVDCSDDQRIDRFFYFKTNLVLLKKFIEGQLSHQDLITSALDGLVVFEDYNIETKASIFLISPIKSIPSAYLPSHEFYYKPEDGVEASKIYNHFKLSEVSTETNVLQIVKAISENKKSETIFIRLRDGRGIRFGAANTQYLGKTLLNFDKLYKEAALDNKLGINRGDVQLTARKNEWLSPFVSTEVYGNIAASYGLLIRPSFSQIDLFNDASDSEKITTSVLSLLSKGQDMELLKEEYKLHSGYTIKSFRNFLDEVLSLQIDMDINWISPLSENEFSDNISYKKAIQIINNLENLSIENEDEFRVKGKFRAVNCDTGHFSFISIGNEKYSGTFDKLVKEGSETINFIKIYEVTVNRKMVKEPGMTNPKIIDIVVSFYEEKE
jgi:hypothetical protein